MADVVPVPRAAWLGHRWHAHGFGPGGAHRDRLDDLLLLGVQGDGASQGERALAQRVARVDRRAVRDAITPAGPLVSTWSVRGAPHAHRASLLDAVRAAHAPHPADDGGREQVAAVARVADALADVVTRPVPKGEASAEVARRVPAALVRWCERCAADHVPDGLFRAGGGQAGLVLATDGRATVLHPPPRVDQVRVEEARPAVLRAFLRVNGPTSRATFREWAGVGTASTAEAWEQVPTVTVQVDGTRSEAPADAVEPLADSPHAEGAVLVPAHDPYLRQVDRTLLVPDRARRSAVYRALSAPGAVLVDGEVAGTWRYRLSERTVTVTPFDPLPPSRRREAGASARRLAEATDQPEPRVAWE